MTSTTKILGLCLLCIMAVPWDGVAQASEVGVTDGDIRIAIFSSLSDPTSTEGRSFFEGARTFFEHVNRMGGIRGRSLTVLPHDMTGDPAGVVAEAHKMLKERNVFSMVVSSDTAATQSLLDQGIGGEPIPVLVGGSLCRPLFSPSRRHVFFFGMPYDDQVVLLVEHVLKRSPGLNPKMALLAEESLLGHEAREGFHRVCTHYGLQSVGEEIYSPGTDDFSLLVNRLSSWGADHTVLGAATSDVTQIIQEASSIGWFPQFLGLSSSVEPETLAGAGEGAEGYLAVDYVARPWEPLPGVSLMVGLTQKLYPRKGARTLHRNHVLGYVSGILVVEGLRTAERELTRESFVHGLEHIQELHTHGLAGVVGFETDSRLCLSTGRVFRFDTVWRGFEPLTDWCHPMMQPSP